MKLFFNYDIDCESPPDGVFGGPESWDFAEASTRGFIEAMETFGARDGASLFVYPDVATKQRALFREMAEAGIEVALHLHTMRYSRVKEPAWLGSLPFEKQLEAIRMARADLEDATGAPCLGFKACYASANEDTFAALEELGFVWSSTSAVGSYRPECYSRWAGAWPYPHHASRVNRLIPGDLDLYQIPTTRAVLTRFALNPNRPIDMRTETPPEIVGENGEMWRTVITENLDHMEKLDPPVRAIVGASHNTNPYGDPDAYQRRNLEWAVRFARELSEERGYEFTPSNFIKIREEADRLGAF